MNLIKKLSCYIINGISYKNFSMIQQVARGTYSVEYINCHKDLYELFLICNTKKYVYQSKGKSFDHSIYDIVLNKMKSLSEKNYEYSLKLEIEKQENFYER